MYSREWAVRPSGLLERCNGTSWTDFGLARSCGPIWRQWSPETMAASRGAGRGFCRVSNKQRHGAIRSLAPRVASPS